MRFLVQSLLFLLVLAALAPGRAAADAAEDEVRRLMLDYFLAVSGEQRVRALEGLKAHQSLGCRGMSRTDIFVADTGKLWVIETNTIPGMTPTSLLPEAAGKASISFSKMLDMIIAASLKNN